MGLLNFTGRVLLVAIFILAGIQKLQEPTKSGAYLAHQYPKFYDHVEKHTKVYFKLPEQLQPSFINGHSTQIIQIVGGLEVALGLLVFLNRKFAGVLLAFMTFAFVVVIHNPFLTTSKDQFNYEGKQALWNLAIAGCLMQVGQRRQRRVCKVEKKADQVKMEEKKAELPKSPQQAKTTSKKKKN